MRGSYAVVWMQIQRKIRTSQGNAYFTEIQKFWSQFLREMPLLLKGCSCFFLMSRLRASLGGPVFQVLWIIRIVLSCDILHSIGLHCIVLQISGALRWMRSCIPHCSRGEPQETTFSAYTSKYKYKKDRNTGTIKIFVLVFHYAKLTLNCKIPDWIQNSDIWNSYSYGLNKKCSIKYCYFQSLDFKRR